MDRSSPQRLFGRIFLPASLAAAITVIMLSAEQTTVARPAVFTVNNTADLIDVTPGNGVCAAFNDTCTLRAAIMEANFSPGVDTIILPAGVYVLTLAGPNENTAVTGDLDVTGDLTITGAGAASTIVDGNAIDRVFEIRSSAGNVDISGVTIRNGRHQSTTGNLGGGGIYNSSSSVLRLTNATLSSNVHAGSVSEPSGVIRNEGILVMSNTVVVSNTAIYIIDNTRTLTMANSVISSNAGVGIRSDPYELGGMTSLANVTIFSNTTGIVNYSPITITNSIIDRNSPGGGIRNIDQFLWDPDMLLINSTVSGNVCTSTCNNGGGIFVEGGTTTLINSAVIRNSAANPAYGNGGGIVASGRTILISSTVSGNFAANRGGGINGWATLISSQVISNTSAREGGGIAGSSALTNSVVMSNTANTSGGGIYGSATLLNSTIAGNSALNGDGGGVHGADYSGRDTILVNSTVSGNRASGDGGGIYYANTYETMQLRNATVTANTADSDANESGNGGGIVSAGGPLTLSHTIVAGNFDNSPIVKYPECDGTITSEGYNLILTISPTCIVTGTTTGNIIGVNPNLSPLADNGGPTPTHALWPGNPAVDNGDPAGCTDETGALLTTDQRGYARPMDGSGDGFPHCDIGAFELGVNSTLSPASASTLVFTDTQGNPTSIAVPAGAVTDTTTLMYSSIDSVTSPSGFLFAGHAFALDAYRGGLRLPGLTFQKPVTVTIRYSDADVNGIHESQLVLMYRGGDNWLDVATTCAPPSTYSRYPISNTLSVAICHLTEYALFGLPVAPAALSVGGPITASVNVPYTLTASTIPVTAALPITYVWEATDHASRVQSGGITDAAVYSWAITGTKRITVTAENLAGMIAGSRVLTVVMPPEYKVYLPVVLRNR